LPETIAEKNMVLKKSWRTILAGILGNSWSFLTTDAGLNLVSEAGGSTVTKPARTSGTALILCKSEEILGVFGTACGFCASYQKEMWYNNI
jgi:hypothetical protein